MNQNVRSSVFEGDANLFGEVLPDVHLKDHVTRLPSLAALCAVFIGRKS